MINEDCDTCHGLGYIYMFPGDIMTNGNTWRGRGTYKVNCPDCNKPWNRLEEMINQMEAT